MYDTIERPQPAKDITRPAAAAAAAPEEKKGFFSFLGFGGRKTKRSNKRLKKSNKRSNKRLKKSKLNKKYKGGMSGRAPESYVGSIGGKFINSNGQQLFRNPVGGIA